MPLMSLWFCFSMPAGLGVYWIANSLWMMIRESILGVLGLAGDVNKFRRHNGSLLLIIISAGLVAAPPGVGAFAHAARFIGCDLLFFILLGLLPPPRRLSSR